MRVAYFDCPAGAAGDMILGALVDAGADWAALRSGLATLPLGGYSLERREVLKGAFRATKVEVHVHDHEHAGGGGAHQHDAPHGHHHHPQRRLRDVAAIIEGSALSPAVKGSALRIFGRLAEAEGRAHGLPADEVHFHDVGAVDAIVDVTGACLGLEMLGAERVHCSALPVGGGWVNGPHGRIPVPAPGTAELLRGFPVVDNGIARELVTPTGAAILTTLAVSAGVLPAMTVRSVGYGAGTMELAVPNVVRLVLGDTAGDLAAPGEAAAGAPGGGPVRETIHQVEATIDDLQPQLYEPLLERLLEAGALDAYLVPVIMKRSRPGIVVTALCEPARTAEVTRVLFAESTTIGARWTPFQRDRLPRETRVLATRYGEVPFKVSRLDGRAVTATPEFEVVRRLARAAGVPVREVLDAARAEGRQLLDRPAGP